MSMQKGTKKSIGKVDVRLSHEESSSSSSHLS